MNNWMTIIIPCYNASGTIGRCLESIFKQTVRNWEIICVDDGSLDDTVSRIKTFESVTVLVNSINRGAAYSRNRGFRHASYSNILFLDSDVFLPPDFLKKISSIERDYEIIYPKILFEDDTPMAPSNIYPNIWSRRAQSYPLCSACFVIKKEAVKKLDELFDDTFKIYYEDTDLFLRSYYFKITSKYAKNIIAYHVLNDQKWSRERLYLECRNMLYTVVKFFPLNFFFPVNYVVRLGMFIHYLSLLRNKKIDINVGFSAFLKVISKSIYWNIINLPMTLRKNLSLKKKLILFLFNHG